MALLNAILAKVKSNDSLRHKMTSPPPELQQIMTKKKKRTLKYSHVRSCVDSKPPRLNCALTSRHLPEWSRRLRNLYRENLIMIMKIKRQHFMRGRVDSRWKELPPGNRQYQKNHVDFLKRVDQENKYLYKRILNTASKVTSTASLYQEWLRNRRSVIENTLANFIRSPRGDEDLGFAAPTLIKRPMVYLKLRVKGGSELGELRVELFTDVCPLTCQLFLELLRGDGIGYGYVGTSFFRKVPNLYWSGGDVIYDNGFGCYAQRRRIKPIGAENYHFPHSIPGLLSMRMTRDNEMCGSFHILFKPLPQFDLQNVVFGKIIQPCSTYESIKCLGSALSSYPVVEVIATRYKVDHRWNYGIPNTMLQRNRPKLHNI